MCVVRSRFAQDGLEARAASAEASLRQAEAALELERASSGTAMVSGTSVMVTCWLWWRVYCGGAYQLWWRVGWVCVHVSGVLGILGVVIVLVVVVVVGRALLVCQTQLKAAMAKTEADAAETLTKLAVLQVGTPVCLSGMPGGAWAFLWSCGDGVFLHFA